MAPGFEEEQEAAHCLGAGVPRGVLGHLTAKWSSEALLKMSVGLFGGVCVFLDYFF